MYLIHVGSADPTAQLPESEPMTSNPDVKINAERVWQRHMDLAKIGATDGGGVHRLALSAKDIEAHCRMAQWAGERGYGIELDAIGNMFIRRPGSDPQAIAVASGSHTDTQPFGGRFDGALGVLAAFEALEALDDAGVSTRRRVARAFAALRTKKATVPWKKHDNIPL